MSIIHLIVFDKCSKKWYATVPQYSKLRAKIEISRVVLSVILIKDVDCFLSDLFGESYPRVCLDEVVSLGIEHI